MANHKSGGSVEYLSPDTLHKNPAFSNVVVVTGHAKTIYVGGQNAVSLEGEVVGKDDIAAQTEQAMKNLQAALQAADADLGHVVRWTLLVVQGQDIRPGFAAFQKVWGERPNPPTITMAFVAALANPDFLVEIDAIAVVPE